MSNQANAAAQEAAKTPNAPTQYLVSPNTAMFLDLLRESDLLHAKIFDTLEKYYGELKQADMWMEKDFRPILQSLRNGIFEYINNSISQNTGKTI